MINLLPPETKEDILFARRNRSLLKWMAALGGSVVGTAVIVAFGLFYISQSTDNYRTQVDQVRADLESQQLAEVQATVEDISTNLKLAVQVLSREILFSKLLTRIGAAVPTNASLTGISITKLSGGIDLSAVATDYETATQVQVNLADPANQIFDKADIVTISCSSSTETRYTCSVTVRAQFAKNNPFLFISSGTTAATGSAQ